MQRLSGEVKLAVGFFSPNPVLKRIATLAAALFPVSVSQFRNRVDGIFVRDRCLSEGNENLFDGLFRLGFDF